MKNSTIQDILISIAGILGLSRPTLNTDDETLELSGSGERLLFLVNLYASEIAASFSWSDLTDVLLFSVSEVRPAARAASDKESKSILVVDRSRLAPNSTMKYPKIALRYITSKDTELRAKDDNNDEGNISRLESCYKNAQVSEFVPEATWEEIVLGYPKRNGVQHVFFFLPEGLCIIPALEKACVGMALMQSDSPFVNITDSNAPIKYKLEDTLLVKRVVAEWKRMHGMDYEIDNQQYSKLFNDLAQEDSKKGFIL